MNSHRKCTFCNDFKRREDMIITPKGAWCSSDHQYESAMKNLNKLQSKEARAATKAKKEAKQKTVQEKRELRARSLPYQLTKTRLYFNEMIRLLDAGQPCISCGKPKCGSRFEAGHFKSVGSHPELRFDARNCYLQGSGCNQAHSGRKRNNLTVAKEYEVRLREKMGGALVDWLNGPHKAKHYTCHDLADLQKLFIAESARLKKGLPASRNWRELPT